LSPRINVALVDCHWFRGSSYFPIGWNWLKAVLLRDWKLFHTFSLSRLPDPEPAIASKSRAKKQLEREFTVKSFSYAT
jgi:hypothetical protein